MPLCAACVFFSAHPCRRIRDIALRGFVELELGNQTYLNTSLVKQIRACDEALHFHELVYAIQARPESIAVRPHPD